MIIPITATTAPSSFFHSNPTFSTPNRPNSSIPYATIIWEMTMMRAAFAGPSEPILRTTVYVIKAPIIPPRSMYFGSTCRIPEIFYLPEKYQMTIQVINAVSCTHPADTQMLVCFVTPVFKTPWMLISAPEINAMIKPVIE